MEEEKNRGILYVAHAMKLNRLGLEAHMHPNYTLIIAQLQRLYNYILAQGNLKPRYIGNAGCVFIATFRPSLSPDTLLWRILVRVAKLQNKWNVIALYCSYDNGFPWKDSIGFHIFPPACTRARRQAISAKRIWLLLPRWWACLPISPFRRSATTHAGSFDAKTKLLFLPFFSCLCALLPVDVHEG